MNDAVIRDAVYNLVPWSGARDEYCHGILVGLVMGLLSEEKGIHRAFELIGHAVSGRGWVRRIPLKRVTPAWHALWQKYVIAEQ